MKRSFIYTLVLVLSGLFMAGCGSFDMMPVTGPNTPTEVAVVEAEVVEDEAAVVGVTDSNGDKADDDPTAGTGDTPPSPTATVDSPTATASDFVTPIPVATADVTTFSQAEAAQWGHAFCPPNIPICLRPYAIESLDNEQLLRVEIWGTDSNYPVASNRVRWSWRADTEQAQNVSGHACNHSYGIYPTYRQGFGHFSDFCFRLVERPSEIRLEFQAQRIVIPFTVGDNLEPVGGWHHFTGSQQLRLETPFPVGTAIVTINSLEEFDDYLVLHVTVQAPSANRLLVNNPEWIVVGHQLRFKSVDAASSRQGWHQGKMRSYEPRLGGEVAAGETADGYVVLQKAAAEWALLILYGAPNVTEEDAVILRLP